MTRLRAIEGRRFFAYLHCMDMHLPYWNNEFKFTFTDSSCVETLQPDGVDVYALRQRTARGQMSAANMRCVVGLYDGEIKYVDTRIARILGELESSGIYDETLVVIPADRGEEFWEHGSFEHGHTLYNELLHVPLLMMGSGLTAIEVDRRVSLIDVMPTVLDLAGVQTERFGFQGTSLVTVIRRQGRGDDEADVFATGTLHGPERYRFFSGSNKLILNTDSKEGEFDLIGPTSGASAELDDLLEDTREQHNVLNERPEIARELGMRLEEFRDLSPMARGRSAVMDEELKRKMGSVGYL